MALKQLPSFAGILLGMALALGAPARADIQVNVRRDKVELVDGTVVECYVLMVTPKGLLVIVKDPEKQDATRQQIIPAERVKKVTRGPDEGAIEGFKTNPELARKVVQGSGYRESEKKAKKDEPVIPSGPIVKAEAPVTLPGPNTKSVSNAKITPKEVAEAYLSRYPALRDAAEMFLGGSSRVPALFEKAKEGDPVLREQLQGFLGLFLRVQTAAPPAAPGTNPVKKTGPAKPAPPAPPPAKKESSPPAAK